MKQPLKPHALIVGGNSGLGQALGVQLLETHDVTVTGRDEPRTDRFKFCALNISESETFYGPEMEKVVFSLPEIDLLVYATGIFQRGTLAALDDHAIVEMVHVGLLGPILLLQKILRKQRILQGFIAITSTSQWTPRAYEPVYTAVKAGLGMFASSVSQDHRIGKVLVAAPAGMKTNFWSGTNTDTRTMLDPKKVAEEILVRYYDDFQYKFIKILRDPARVEVVETSY